VTESETIDAAGPELGAEPNEVDADPIDEDAAEVDGAEVDEADVAADFIEELLDICDLDGDIDIDMVGDRPHISVTASADSNLRILSSAEAVAALQELTRLAVQSRTGEFSRLILDVGGSRQARQNELAVLVDAALRALDGGATRYPLEPMSSYERKIVHDLAAERGLASVSEGEGRDRHTVLTRA